MARPTTATLIRGFPGTLAAAILASIAGGPANAADYNGDGYADLAWGVPGEDVGANPDAGAVNVVYGTAAGLVAPGNPAINPVAAGPISQLWTQKSWQVPNLPADRILDSSDTADGFGWATASGDFNGDGYDDLAIGVPGEDAVGAIDSGAVNIIYGSAAGLKAAAGPGNQFFREPGKAAGDAFGKVLAVGDFNYDGFADLAVGIPLRDVVAGGIQVDAGEVRVFYGSVSGILTGGSSLLRGKWWGDNVEAGDRFGGALASGDLDWIPGDELAVGEPGEDIAGVVDAGAVVLFYGGTGAKMMPPPIWGPMLLTQSSYSWDPDEAGDAFGSSVAMADFDGDQVGDLAMGAPYEDLPGSVDAGQVTITFGVRNMHLQGFWGGALLNQDTWPGLEVAEANDHFGFSLAAGDFDANVLGDLLIGSKGESYPSQANAGCAHVAYGPIDPWGTVPSAALLKQGAGGLAEQSEANDAFGWALSAGDFNGDGNEDAAIAAAYETLGPSMNAGIIHAVYGSGVGLTGAGSQMWHQNVAGVPGANASGDTSGFSLSDGP